MFSHMPAATNWWQTNDVALPLHYLTALKPAGPRCRRCFFEREACSLARAEGICADQPLRRASLAGRCPYGPCQGRWGTSPYQENSQVRKAKKRKDYAFRRQFNGKPDIIPGCPATIR